MEAPPKTTAFALYMGLVSALLVGGGIYAYNYAVHEVEAHHAAATAGHGTSSSHGDVVPHSTETGATSTQALSPDTAPVDPQAAINAPRDAGAPDAVPPGASPEEAAAAVQATSPQAPPELATAPDNLAPVPGATIARGQPSDQSFPEGEALARTRGNPESGGVVYSANCQGCHGEGGAGGPIGPSLVQSGSVPNWTVEEFVLTLRQGQTPVRTLSAGMPRYTEAQLSDEQVYDLHAYLTSGQQGQSGEGGQ